MNRFTLFVLPLFIALIAGRTPAADRTNTDAIRQQFRAVEQKIEDVRTKIREEIAAELAGKPGVTVNWNAINEALSGDLFADKVKSVDGDLGLETGPPVGAKLLRDKLIELRKPLDELNAQEAALNADYAEKNKSTWDLGPFGTAGQWKEQLQEIKDKLAKIAKDRPKAIKQIEDRMKSDSDLSSYKTLEDFEKGVTRSYQKYYDQIFGAGKAEGERNWHDKLFGPAERKKDTETRAFRVRRLLFDLSQLIADRDRLVKLLKDAGNRWVVWYNEIGWLYVGTVESWEREQFRTRGSETWGGHSAEKLISTQILKGREFWSQEAAVKALLAEAGGPGYIARHPLAFPKITRNVKIGGKEYYLSSSVTGDVGFQAAATKADEEAKQAEAEAKLLGK